MSSRYVILDARVSKTGDILQYGLLELSSEGLEKAEKAVTLTSACEYIDSSALLSVLPEGALPFIPFWNALDADVPIYLPDDTVELKGALAILLTMPVLELGSDSQFAVSGTILSNFSEAECTSICTRLWDIILKFTRIWRSEECFSVQFKRGKLNLLSLPSFDSSNTDYSKILIPDGVFGVESMWVEESDCKSVNIYAPRSLAISLLGTFRSIDTVNLFWTKQAGYGSVVCDGIIPYFTMTSTLGTAREVIMTSHRLQTANLIAHCNFESLRCCENSLTNIRCKLLDLSDTEFGCGYGDKYEMYRVLFDSSINNLKMGASFGHRKWLIGAFDMTYVEFLDLRAVDFRPDVQLWSKDDVICSLFYRARIAQRVLFDLDKLANVAQINEHPDELWRLFLGIHLDISATKGHRPVEVCLEHCNEHEQLASAFEKAVAYPVFRGGLTVTRI